jgi:hypothetical protein
MNIPIDKAKDIAEQMFRSIDAIELMDLYDSFEYEDPADALAETIKENPLAIIEFLSDLVEGYSEKYKED